MTMTSPLRRLASLAVIAPTFIAACSDPTVPPSGRLDQLAPSADVNAEATGNWEATLLPLLPGGTWMQATAINDSGTIVGYGDVAGGAVHAFRYKHGTMRDLGTQPGYPSSRALGINLRGEVVGSATTALRPLAQTAVLWTPTGVLTRLPGTDTLPRSVAQAINNSSVVVGKIGVGRGDWHAARWNRTRVEDLNPWVERGLSTEARAINASGTIVGFGDFYTTFALYSGVRWDAAKNMTVIKPLNNGVDLYADSSRAYDINDSGQWVGWSSYPTNANTETYISWFSYEFYPPATGVLGAPESAISNKRRHVGTVRINARRNRAFSSMWFNGGDYGDLLPLPAPYFMSHGVDVNTCGHVVGWAALQGAQGKRAALWRRYVRGQNRRLYPCD
jgi:probable HAF family extracellular repeat protein